MKPEQVFDLSMESRFHFRDQFRRARLAALGDAENFHDIVYGVERLGLALSKKIDALGKYKEKIVELAVTSPLANDLPESFREYFLPFSDLYDIVKDGRNDALHQGAAARHLVVHAVQLALVLEDALMPAEPKVADFMIRDPICAAHWQPVSFVRQQMLANSFSYLPILWSLEDEKTWCVVSDFAVSRFLRSATSKEDRKRRLAISMKEALEQKQLFLECVRVGTPELSLADVISDLRNLPILIVEKDTKNADDEPRLLGLITAFDLL